MVGIVTLHRIITFRHGCTLITAGVFVRPLCPPHLGGIAVGTLDLHCLVGRRLLEDVIR